MITRILRKMSNTVVTLVCGMLSLVFMYIGGAALLGLTYGVHLIAMPLVAPYVPQSLDLRLLILMWLACATVGMVAIGSALAYPVTWILDKLYVAEKRFSFA